LAAGFSLVRRQGLALDGESAPLLVGEGDALESGGLLECLPEHARLFLQVLELERHALVDRVGHHGDDELER
jgi:hypothetical protein